MISPVALYHLGTTPPSPFTAFRERANQHETVTALLDQVDALEFKLDQAVSRAEELADLVRELEANR